MRRILRRLIRAASLSGEPSGNSGRMFVIRAARSQSSIFAMRISSFIVRTLIISSIISTAPIAAFWWRPCAGGGGCIAWDRNEGKECAALAAMQPTNGAKRPEEGGVGAEGMEEAGADKSRVADF